MDEGLYSQYSQEALMGFQAENGQYSEVGYENPYSSSETQNPYAAAENPYSTDNPYASAENAYNAEFGEEYAHPQGQFQALNHVVGDGGVGISALHFDSSEELLWMGNTNGHVTSYYGPHLQKYTSFQVHQNEGVRYLYSFDRGILALSQTSLRCQLRRGIPLFTHTSQHMSEMQCMLQIPQRPNQLLMGGIQEKLISLDIDKVKEIQVIDTGGDCAVLRYNNRFVGCGETSGKITLRDPHNMTICHSLDTHSGTLSDFDMNGHHLVTCGFARRHGNMQAIDRFLMVYDLRILRSVNPIQCLVEPCQLRFLTTMSKIVVMSSNGQVQLVDTADMGSENLDIFQVETGGAMALSFDVSPSNQSLAFGDDHSSISLFSNAGNTEPSFNIYPRETEFPHPLPSFPHMSIDDPHAIYSSIPLPHLPPGETQYVSDNWPARFAREIYRPIPEIDPQILKAMKMVGTIGYAPNLGNKKRNVIQYNLNRHSDKESENRRQNQSVDENSAYKSSVPKRYKKHDIKLGKMGADDFDFDNFNKTSFCGLEASLPNSYCNAMLQVLYFTEKLRIILLNHNCARESCLACELSFLFHMLDTGQGMPCQPANFLRALRTIPEASALGLIFSEANSIARTSVPRIIQSWNRFILQQIHQQTTDLPTTNVVSRCVTPPPQPNLLPGHLAGADWSRSSPAKKTPDPVALAEIASISKDMADVLSGSQKTEAEETIIDESHVSQLMGMKQDKITRCSKCRTKTTTDNLLLLCNLVYPEQSTLKQKVTFPEILCSSLCPEQVTPAWCEKCKKYQPTTQSRRLRSLPYTLSLNAGMDNQADISFWNTQMHMIMEEAEGGTADTTAKAKVDTVHQQTPPQGQKACRYGGSCNRADCKFWHKGQELLKEPALDVGDKLAKIDKSWVPFELTLHLASDGTVHSSNDVPKLEFIESQTYLLYAVCCNVIDPVNPDTTNLVSCVKVGPTYHARVGSAVSQWYIFNDFTINPIPPQEAVWFNLKWKIPCVLCFTAQKMSASIGEFRYKNPITEEVFSEDKSLLQKAGGKRITFTPLKHEEIPKKGDLIAIDAEFVTLNQEEAELRSDGKVSTVKAAHMSVARITCVRGQGRLEGVPFIDDYISTQEQVVDYLTKFSGIKPGDLDANFSSKHLTTLKSTYQKLRFIADCGAIFIGHGLKNDFRVINLVVSTTQVIDTLHLFHLPHHRYVSLKFLAWFFLKSKIQGATHDSIEDAVTSLRLYRKYLEFKKENSVGENLTKMYEVGKEINWKVPE